MSEKHKNLCTVCMTALFLFGFAIWSIVQPDAAESRSERRRLAQMPELSAEAIRSGEWMSNFEQYTLDQFPLRDRFRTVKAAAAFYLFRQKDNNKIYIQDGYASKLEYPMDTKSVQYAARRFHWVYAHYLQDRDTNIYLSVIPDKNYFLAASGGYPAMDYAALTDTLMADMDFAEYIDITGLLERSDFYRTDTHWRQDAIVDVARALADGMGVSLSAEFTAVKAEQPFYGVYFGQSALPLPSDELYYLTHPYLDGCTVFDYETNTYIPIYDLSRLSGNDPYEVFLSGSKSLLRIENPAAATERELICFRDSFGSSIAPLLAEGYRTVTLVDIRYLSPEMLGQFLEFHNQDVLFLYSSTVLNNSITIK